MRVETGERILINQKRECFCIIKGVLMEDDDEEMKRIEQEKMKEMTRKALQKDGEQSIDKPITVTDATFKETV